MRLDKYLKVSRIIKRRTVGKPARASYDVKVGDVIELTFGSNTSRFEVLSVTEHATKESAALMFRQL